MWIFAGGVLLFVGLMGILSPAYRAFLAGSGGPRARIGAVTGAGGHRVVLVGLLGGPGRRPRRAPPDAETCSSHSKVQFQPSFSSAKCTSREQNAHLDDEGAGRGPRGPRRS